MGTGSSLVQFPAPWSVHATRETAIALLLKIELIVGPSVSPVDGQPNARWLMTPRRAGLTGLGRLFPPNTASILGV